MGSAKQTDKELVELIKEFESLNPDWRIEDTRNGLRFLGPDKQLVFTHRTQSDHRAMANLRAQLRREGATLAHANGQVNRKTAGKNTPQARSETPAQAAAKIATSGSGRPTLRYEKTAPAAPTENRGGRRTTFIHTVLLALKQNPYRELTLDELADALPGLRHEQIQGAMYRLRANHGLDVRCHVAGRVWSYHPTVEDQVTDDETDFEIPEEPAPEPKLKKLVTAPTPFTRVFEQVRDLGDGELLLRDDQGHVYTAKLERLDGGA